jgi:hypothetical protein
LEILKSDTWIELAETYRDLLFIKSIFSGLSNYYGKVPYTFLAIVTISGLEMLSDAIVCRVKWNDLSVLHKRDIILGDN